MLEFVHVSGADGGKDVETRRKVRSQAMRDFRRRQRAEREAANKANQPQSTKATSKKRTSSNQRGTSSGLTGPNRPGDRPASHVRDESLPSPAFLSDLDAARSASGSQTPSIMLYGDYFSDEIPGVLIVAESPDCTQLEWSRSDAAATRSRSPSVLPQSPSTWGTETEDPFQSPAQTHQMLAFCMSCACVTANPTLCDACTDGSCTGRAPAGAWY